MAAFPPLVLWTFKKWILPLGNGSLVMVGILVLVMPVDSDLKGIPTKVSASIWAVSGSCCCLLARMEKVPLLVGTGTWYFLRISLFSLFDLTVCW
jgi:hypothetical protein